MTPPPDARPTGEAVLARHLAVMERPDDLAGRRAVREFCDWLYERGPNPDEMPRERLLALYWAWKRGQDDGR